MSIKGLKTRFKITLSILFFIVFFILSLFYISKSIYKKLMVQTLGISSQVVNANLHGLPMRLSIPIININTKIQHLGVTQTGEMDVPSNSFDVGWFKLGPRPGEIGSAVIAGHFDREDGGEGVFANLYKLKKGDKLFITDNKGKVTTFVVRESRTYDPGYADDVFSESDNAHLNLITCDGVWDGTKKSYSKRLVVFTDIIL